MFVPDREELAYAAGLFEGEGSITMQRHGRYPNILLGIVMTDLEPLQQFHRAVGGLGHIAGPYKSHGPDKTKTYKVRYLWQTAKREHAQAVIAMLWPWLGPRRRARAAQAQDEVAAWAYPEVA